MCCDHKFVYGGVRFKAEMAPRGGHQYVYAEWFFCEKCLEEKQFPLSGSSSTYNAPKYNATPMKKESA